MAPNPRWVLTQAHHNTLQAIAGEVGLDQAMIARLFDSGSDTADIAARVQHSRSRGVNSVPTFIIAGKHAVQGAQPTDLWIGLIDDLNAQLKEQAE